VTTPLGRHGLTGVRGRAGVGALHVGDRDGRGRLRRSGEPESERSGDESKRGDGSRDPRGDHPPEVGPTK
jgi:hypothetical protein